MKLYFENEHHLSSQSSTSLTTKTSALCPHQFFTAMLTFISFICITALRVTCFHFGLSFCAAIPSSLTLTCRFKINAGPKKYINISKVDMMLFYIIPFEKQFCTYLKVLRHGGCGAAGRHTLGLSNTHSVAWPHSAFCRFILHGTIHTLCYTPENLNSAQCKTSSAPE